MMTMTMMMVMMMLKMMRSIVNLTTQAHSSQPCLPFFLLLTFTGENDDNYDNHDAYDDDDSTPVPFIDSSIDSTHGVKTNKLTKPFKTGK